jgi:lipopolysaccharide transport system permease protein
LAVQATASPAASAPTVGRAPEVVTVHAFPASAFRALRDAWRARDLVPWLGTRVLVKIIWGTKLGPAWLVLRPLMDTLGKALIFGGLLGVAAPGGMPYFVFLLAGMIAWRFFERLVFYATRSFDFYRKSMTELDIPLLLVPISAGMFPLVEIAVYVAVFLGAILYFAVVNGQFYLQTGPQLLLFPAGVAILVTTALGIGFWTSVLNGKARDTRLTIRYVLDFWLYLTPVVYPLTAVPPAYRWLAEINPVTAPVELVKEGLIGTGSVSPEPVLWSLAFAALMFVSGLWFFSRHAIRSVDLHGFDEDEDEDERATA